MAEPVIELIAEEIKTRLETIDCVTVTRPKRINDEPTGDRVITLTQGARSMNSAIGYVSNPPVIGFDQIFVITAEVRPSELDETPIETIQDRFEAEIRSAICGVADWHTFGSRAVNSDIGAVRVVRDMENVSLQMDLLVQYRHPENDSTTVA